MSGRYLMLADSWLEAEDTSGQIDAADLLDSGHCSPQCLLAREPDGDCSCRCHRRYHGVLANALIPVNPKPSWYARHCGWAQILLDDLVPVVGNIDAYNNLHRASVRAQVPFAAVQRFDKWEMYFHPDTEARDSQLTDDATRLFSQLLGSLITARRVDAGCPGPYMCSALGVRTQVEAQVLGAIARELFCGNHDGARSCLNALREDGF